MSKMSKNDQKNFNWLISNLLSKFDNFNFTDACTPASQSMSWVANENIRYINL